MVIRHILLKRKNHIGSVVDIVSVWKVLSVFCIMFVLLIGCGEPNVDDPKVREKIMAEAIEYDKLQTRKSPSGEELRYAPNQEKPYIGWIKTNWTLQQFQNGKPNGLYIEWYESGQNEEKGTMRNGTKDGRWTYWYENGQKEHEGTYKNGERNGLWTEWYENGQKVREKTWKNGKEDGRWTYWYENGQKEHEGTYKNGERNGLWTEWYENGQKYEEGTYKNGKRDGRWTYWDKNGQKERENTYKNDKADGLCTFWDENGQKDFSCRISYKDTSIIPDQDTSNNGVVQGVIVDATTKKNQIAGVRIGLLRSGGAQWEWWSNSKQDGTFYFDSLRAGRYIISFFYKDQDERHTTPILLISNNIIDIEIKCY